MKYIITIIIMVYTTQILYSIFSQLKQIKPFDYLSGQTTSSIDSSSENSYNFYHKKSFVNKNWNIEMNANTTTQTIKTAINWV